MTATDQDPRTPMRLQTVPAGHGTLWVRHAFRTFFKRPMAFAALFATFMFAALVFRLLPFIGSLMFPALFPLVALGFMIATRVTLDGGFPTPRVFIEPLRGKGLRVRAMWQMCLICAVSIVAAMWLCDVVDGGAFDARMEALSTSQATPESIAESLNAPGLFSGLMLRYAVIGLLLLPFWHAPALVYSGGYGCAQALFSTTIAWWRNRGALIVYALTWFALFMTILMIGGVVATLLGQPQILMVAALPLCLLFATLFYVSLYFTFTDSYVATDSTALPGTA
jgi:hypothetical protein